MEVRFGLTLWQWAETTLHENLTSWRQFFMCLACYWSWILSWHCQSSLQIHSVAVDHQVDPLTTLTMLWWNSSSITGQTHEKRTPICFFMLTNCQIVCSHSLTHRINYKAMCLSAYWQWKLATEHARISAVIVKMIIYIWKVAEQSLS